MTGLTRIVKKCKTVLAESVYSGFLKRHKGLILWCVLISVFLCILTNPGIIYSDSYGRIERADSLRYSIHAFFSGDSQLNTLNSWTTVTPSYFILLSKLIVGSVVLYTFVQCFFLFFVSYLFGMNITEEGHQKWNVMLLTLLPVLWGYGVYYEASVGCAAALMAILLLIFKWECLQTRFDKVLSLILMTFISFVCFGYRANAFTIIPVLLIIVIIKERRSLKTLGIITTIIIGFAFTYIIPKMLNVDTMSSYAGAFVWETVSTIQTMDNTTREKYDDYFDDIFGEGTTTAALDRNSFSSINSIWWGNPFSTFELSKPENSKAVLKKFFNLVKAEPLTYFKVKWEFISHTMGINKPLAMAEYPYDDGGMAQIDFNDSKQRAFFVGYFVAFMQFMEVFRRPWIFFSVAFVLLLIYKLKFAKERKRLTLYEMAYGVALFYYGCYVLNTQSFEFRYYFPSWLLLFLIIVSISADILFRYAHAKKVAAVTLIMTVLVCCLGAYNIYTKNGNELINTIETTGNLIYEENGHSVFLADNKLYFVAEAGQDTVYDYFLHFWSMTDEYMDRSFVFDDHKVVSDFRGKQMAVIDLPEEELQSLEFGQYYGETIFWFTFMRLVE